MADLMGQRLGQYEIVALLGEGDMATVFRAWLSLLVRDVAVKVIDSRQAGKAEFIAHFERSARILGQLRHSNIVQIIDYAGHDELIYQVLQLLPGGTLADLISQQDSLPLETVSRILDQVASALDYVHQRGVIHRNLKPSHILFDAHGNAVLTGFGIAKLLTESKSLTQPGVAMGTPAYMAPEQWQGQPLDARTDSYALGLMLLEMLTGRVPFIADTSYGLMHMHLHELPPSLHSLREDLPPGLDQIVEWALAKERDERFASALELVSAFKAALMTDQ